MSVAGFDKALLALKSEASKLRAELAEKIDQLDKREADYPGRVEREVAERTASLDQIEAKREALEGWKRGLDERAKELDALAERYDKTAAEVRAEVEPGIEERWRSAAESEISAARLAASEKVAKAQAESRRAVERAESTRIEELTLLLNRMAHVLADRCPEHEAAWDYLVLTNQVRGRSRRKDCTDADLRRIREQHQGRVQRFAK